MTIKKMIQEKINNYGMLSIVLIVATAFLFVMYVWQVNASSTAGFAMRDIEREITQLERENDRLNVRIAELQSVESVSRRLRMLGLQPVRDITYIVSNSTIALNQ